MDTEAPISYPDPETRGTWRTVGSIVCSIGAIVSVIPNPAISVWGLTAMYLGAAIGGAGVCRAITNGTLFNLTSKED